MQFKRNRAFCLSISILLFCVFQIVSVALSDTLNSYGVESKNPYVLRRFLDNGKLIDEVIVPGRPPVSYREPEAIIPESSSAAGIQTLSNVPAFDWSYGCSATSAAMMFGYYDNGGYPNVYTGPTNGGVCPMTNAAWGYGETPLSATHQGLDGRLIKGHVDDYWIAYDSNAPDPFIGNWTEHIQGECTADFMGTNQSLKSNTDGSTTFYNYTNGSPLYDYVPSDTSKRDGCHGMRLFFESRGYTVTSNYSQYIYGYNGNTLGFTFAQYKQEIDAGRPVLIQVSGHTMLGYGYDDSSSLVYLHDTWDHVSHSMTWGGSYRGMQHYAVTVFIPSPNLILSVTPSNRDVAKEIGTTTFDVSNTGTGTMAWTAEVTSGGSWLSITSGDNGSNAGTINCSFDTNTNSSARTGTIRVTAVGANGSPMDVTVIQEETPAQGKEISKIMEWNGNIVADFGQDQGLYLNDGSTWTQLTGWGNVHNMLVWGSNLVVDFGDGRGLFVNNGTGWTQLTGWDDSSNMLVWNNGTTNNLVVDFGQGRGLYYNNGSTWNLLTGWDDTSNMLVWDNGATNNLVVDFGQGRGLYYNDGSTWNLLTGWDDTLNMLVWNNGTTNNLVVEFGGGRGLYYNDGSSWNLLTGWDGANRMLVWNNRLVADFGGGRGLYYNDGAWHELTGWDDTADMITWNTGASNRLVADFGGGRGLYYNDGSSWNSLTGYDDTHRMITWGNHLVVDFGGGRGLYYNDGSWHELMGWDDTAELLEWDASLVSDFGPGKGVYKYSGIWTELTGWSTAD